MCRKVRLGICSWLLLSSVVLLFISAASQNQETQELKTTSSLIKEELQNLKQKSEELNKNLALVTQDLKRTSEDLRISEQKVQELQAQSTELSTSLINMNQLLSNSYETITRYEAQLKMKNKILTTLIIIFAVMILLKIAGYILYAKGIKVPRWIDILI